MKKLLVVLFAAMLVLGLSATSMAAISWSGEIKTGYIWVDTWEDGTFLGDAETVAADDSVSYNKLTLKLDAKVSDTVNAYAKLENDGKAFKIDEAWFAAKTSIGKLTFGKYEYNITGVAGEGELEMIADDSPLGDEFKFPFEIVWDATGLPEGLFLKAIYARETASYVLGLGYCTEKWGAGYNVIHYGEISYYEDIDDEDSEETFKDFNGWTANLFFKPIENLTLYAHFQDVEDFDDVEAAIVGVYGELGNFFAYYEYNLEDRADENTYGYKLGYNFSNKIELSYEYADMWGQLYNQGLYLKVKFK